MCEGRTTRMANAAVSARLAARLPNGGIKAGTFMASIYFYRSLFLKTASLPSLLSFSRGRSVDALALRLGDGSGGSNDGLLQGVGDKKAVEAVKNILEMASKALSRREILHTDFLTPPVVKVSISALDKLAYVKTVAQGGYPQAERCRLSIGHPEMMTIDPDIVAALSISGNFGFGHYSHGDFLGAILSTGIARVKVGDILLQEGKGAQVLVVPELVGFLISALDQVGNVSVSCEQIPLLSLEYELPRTQSFKTVEASLRVDALASAGFKISRSKLSDLISNGDVRVNWSAVMKNNTILKTGDLVSVNGKGRLKIGEINTTRKGKFAVELIRYL